MRRDDRPVTEVSSNDWLISCCKQSFVREGVVTLLKILGMLAWSGILIVHNWRSGSVCWSTGG